MQTFPRQTDNHNTHDEQWCIVSTENQLPLCFACLVEHLEAESVTTVQKQFHLSALADVVRDCDEVQQLLREHPRVCQHVLDILVDQYTDSSFVTVSVQVCVQLMDTLQSEEFYVYLLDKFQYQIENNPAAVLYVVNLLGKLSVISSAYVLTLILSHEDMLLSLLAAHTRAEPFQDDASHCALLFLLIRLFDVDVLPVVPPQVLPLVEHWLVTCMTEAQSLDLQTNALALLKRMLSTDCCLWQDSSHGIWAALIAGFKRVFVSKREVLVTAATQCLVLIASKPRHAAAHALFLKSSLPEFLFESLHTMNGAQLEAVFNCLQLFAEHDLFFTKCHALYGLESVLRSLNVALDSHNTQVLVEGFNLLSSILLRHPSSTLRAVSKSAVEMVLSVTTRGATCQALHVVLPALTAATAFFKDPEMTKQLPMVSLQSIVEAALVKVGGAVWKGEAPTLLSSLKVTEQQLLDTLLSLLSAVTKLPKKEGEVLFSRIAEETINILSYVNDHFTASKDSTLRNLMSFLNNMYKGQPIQMQTVSAIAVSSGFVLQILQKRAENRTDLDFLSSANGFVANVFHGLLTNDVPQYDSLPQHLKSGLRDLAVMGSLSETVGDVKDEETADALCMILYFATLNDSQVFSSCHVAYALADLHARQLLKCVSSKPLTCRFLLYLLAWATEQPADNEDSSFIQTNDVERAVLQQLSDLPVDVWVSHHPNVFHWLFRTQHRAQGPGAHLLEHWLLHTKGDDLVVGRVSSLSSVHQTMFLNCHFRSVMLQLMASTSEEISVLTRNLFLKLIPPANVEDEHSQTISCVYEEVMSSFLDLFLRSLQQPGHVVNTYLQVVASLVQLPQYQQEEADLNRQVRVIYHVVDFISALGTEGRDLEVLASGMACLHFLSKVTDQEQDTAVVPILLQNKSFLQQLESCIHKKEEQLSSVALSLASWIASACSDTMNHPIHVDMETVLRKLTNGDCENVEAALQVLCLYLVSSCAELTNPLTFHRTQGFLSAGHLFSAQELRLIFCHVQQYIFSEDKQTQFCAVQCYLKLIQHGFQTDNALGQHFLHHPWNPQVLHFLLSKTVNTGMELNLADLITELWSDEGDDQVDTATLVLQSVLATEISLDNQDTLLALVEKAKPLCQDKDLVERCLQRQGPLEDSLSFSQNTPTPC